MKKETTYKTTEKGLNKLITELKKREGEIREKIKQAIEDAMAQGDQSENDGYDLAIDDQRENEIRIEELKDKIEKAEVIACEDKETINIGCNFTMKGDKELSYEVTGADEANPLEGKISYLSPIGQAVIGKKVGDEVKIQTPQGEKKYKIIRVS